MGEIVAKELADFFEYEMKEERRRAERYAGILREHLPLFHRMTRRVAPGFRDDGLVSLSSHRHASVDEHHVCVGCEIQAALAVVRPTEGEELAAGFDVWWDSHEPIEPEPSRYEIARVAWMAARAAAPEAPLAPETDDEDQSSGDDPIARPHTVQAQVTYVQGRPKKIHYDPLPGEGEWT